MMEKSRNRLIQLRRQKALDDAEERHLYFLLSGIKVDYSEIKEIIYLIKHFSKVLEEKKDASSWIYMPPPSTGSNKKDHHRKETMMKLYTEIMDIERVRAYGFESYSDLYRRRNKNNACFVLPWMVKSWKEIYYP